MTWALRTDPIVSFLLSLALLIVTYLLQPRVRIVWTNTHNFCHRLLPRPPDQKVTPESNSAAEPEPAQKEIGVRSASIIVQNRGRAPAQGIEITLNWKPWGLSVWPQRTYKTLQNPEGRLTIGLPNLASHESIQVHMADTIDLPAVLTSVIGAQTLDDRGITKRQSSDWQKLAQLPKKEFEKILSKPGGPGEPQDGRFIGRWRCEPTW